MAFYHGVRSKALMGNIHEIRITGYGPADVGPYKELTSYVKKNSALWHGMELECHHIVEVEHLEMLNWPLTKAIAPSVAIPYSLHRELMSTRFTCETNYHGGRRGGKATLTKSELRDMYKQVYTWHTDFEELYTIACDILR